MSPLRNLALTALALGLPVFSAAQGLGAVAAQARQERESRATEAEETEPRSYSNDDLEGLAERTNEDSEGTVSTTGDPSGSSTSGPAPARSRPPTPAEEREAHLQRFEEAVTQARSGVTALEATVEDLQQRLNPMSTTYVYGGTGGPVGGTQSDEEQRVRRELAAAEQQLGQAREEVTLAEEALDQARRAGPEPRRY